jgi:hypothetical protein
MSTACIVEVRSIQETVARVDQMQTCQDSDGEAWHIWLNGNMNASKQRQQLDTCRRFDLLRPAMTTPYRVPLLSRSTKDQEPILTIRIREARDWLQGLVPAPIQASAGLSHGLPQPRLSEQCWRLDHQFISIPHCQTAITRRRRLVTPCVSRHHAEEAGFSLPAVLICC